MTSADDDELNPPGDPVQDPPRDPFTGRRAARGVAGLAACGATEDDLASAGVGTPAVVTSIDG